ncbi:helix-turn-helix transcriptional regulator [Siphonobacter sp. SORGH_AS_0500]|uniref:AraC family transcriptional regulator n=1 Tax=Siphonobacter sp. SORGH_AS_0500 TaxID=1864824 RepID=UPI002855EE4A|nr:helix-turn-helix transcriptional regulator [Siphonobacter sp. SORGH_AS_0500]MDR6197606.1 AraC family transcriptional activator of pobA [Siphonobacter sp. SORGH_AS_0500]
MTQENIALYSIIESGSGIEIQSFAFEEINPSAKEKVMIPHRHDHYCCFILEKGSVNFSIDFQNISFHTAGLLISCPGQVHHLSHMKDAQGWMIALNPSLIDLNARNTIDQAISRIVLMDLNTDQLAWFVDLLRLIDCCVNQPQVELFQNPILHHLLNAFFYQAANLFQAQETKRIQEYSVRSIDISKTFQKLVKEHFLNLKKPADYASRMNITVSYLNDTVKSITGFSSTYFIQQEIIHEAQRRLFYTSQSIKEIAYALGYEDYKYFIRLFSKTVGKSPAQFRKNHL